MGGLLKFIACGSVDDGKSTLIGHMLYDAKLLFADQRRALELDSRTGSRDGKIDYSLLLDGLMAEREQGITIDVAYRYFTTDRRSFIVADTPGHEEYTRNMAVGASFADLAVILVDALEGILTQTRRHARICALMGIRQFVFAVNKMDLVRYDERRYREIEKEIQKLSIDLDLENVKAIPVSATEGDNITAPSKNMPWYDAGDNGTLLHYLETVEIQEKEDGDGFVLPVQRVCRPDHTFRGFQGEIAEGSVAVGDTITVLPGGETASVREILVTDREAQSARRGQPVTIRLDREVDVSRGCVLVRGTDLETGTMLNAEILWMDDEDLVPGRDFWLRVGTKTLPATVMSIKYRVNINTGGHLPSSRLARNELTSCDIALSGKAVYGAFAQHKELGCFVLIDRVTHMTSACGVIRHSLRRSANLFWQQTDITRDTRAQKLGQRPKTLWFTGLSGAGKSTLANALEKALAMQGKHTMLLDGDNVRMGLNRNLGFTEKDRVENIRRIAEVAKLMNDAGLIVLTAFISPYRADRERAREIVGAGDFIEIYVSTPLESCEQRDVKGLYRKARAGEIPNFTGISSPYEPPAHPQITIDTSGQTLEESISLLLQALGEHLG